jgi:hypothetical protein
LVQPIEACCETARETGVNWYFFHQKNWREAFS